jgi:hypothetical protein
MSALHPKADILARKRSTKMLWSFRIPQGGRLSRRANRSENSKAAG